MIIFQGQTLPALRPGKVYAVQLYPGGRKAAKQVEPAQVRTVGHAANELLAGHMTYVALGDADEAWQRYQTGKEENTKAEEPAAALRWSALNHDEYPAATCTIGAFSATIQAVDPGADNGYNNRRWTVRHDDAVIGTGYVLGSGSAHRMVECALRVAGATIGGGEQ